MADVPVTTPADLPLVLAAGGAVWRRREGGVEVVLVHRPRYDDWSLPKGKLEPAETAAEAAVREVQEEAGVTCDLGPELVTTDYLDRSGKQKSVRYWAMTVREGEVHADHEVDVAAWVPIDTARRRLTYERDQPVLDALARLLAG